MEMETLFSYPSSLAGVLALIIFCYLVFRKVIPSNHREAPEAAGGWPIIGHLPLLAGHQLPHITLGALADKHGPIFRIRLGVHSHLVISSWEVAKECYTKYDSVISSRPKSLEGKLLAYDYAGFGSRIYDSFCRNIRKIIASELMSSRRLELQILVPVSEVKRSVKELYNRWTNRETDSDHLLVDMDEWIGNVNLNVILMMVCGKRFFGDDEAKRCLKAMRGFFDLSGKFVVGDAIPFLSWLDLGGYEKAMKKTADELDSLVGEWLEEHRRKRDSGAADGERDFMDIIMSIIEDQGMDLAGYDADTVIKATCMGIIVGGADTTTVTLAWALSLLLNNREALRRAQEELDIHVENGRLVNETDISKLVYLQAIVKETLRLYPAGPLSGFREFSQDCNVAGYHVPSGTRLITNIWKIQTDPRVWPEPLDFKPERFLVDPKEADVNGRNFEFIPFGVGRRACPGWGFGLQMTHLVLATLVHCLELTTPSDEPVDMTAELGLTISRATPLQVLVKPASYPVLMSDCFLGVLYKCHTFLYLLYKSTKSVM